MQRVKHDNIDELISKAKENKELLRRGRFRPLNPGAGVDVEPESPRSPRMPSVCAVGVDVVVGWFCLVGWDGQGCCC